MKKLVLFLIAAAIAISGNIDAAAQNREVTIILFRHAERFPTTKENNSNPELTETGRERAKKLVDILKPYKPEQIFSTNLKRTVATVTPLADNLDEKYRVQIQKYDTEELQAFADKLLNLGAKTIVVAGHNNTTPALANLLIKEEKYKQFGENEYDKIIIVRIKKGRDRAEMITY